MGVEFCFVNYCGGVELVCVFVDVVCVFGVMLGFILCILIVVDCESVELLMMFIIFVLLLGYFEGILVVLDVCVVGIEVVVVFG